MADIAKLAQQVAEELEGECRAEDDGTYTIVVDDGETMMPDAVLYADAIEDGPAAGTELLVVRAAAVELEPDQEFLELLLADEAATTWFARTYLDTDEGQPTMLVAEAAIPLAGLSLELAALVVAEVIELADSARDLAEDEDEDE
jgi:hypothetical protein